MCSWTETDFEIVFVEQYDLPPHSLGAALKAEEIPQVIDLLVNTEDKNDSNETYAAARRYLVLWVLEEDRVSSTFAER